MGVDFHCLPRENFMRKKSDGWVTIGTLKTNPSEICHINSFGKMTNEIYCFSNFVNTMCPTNDQRRI